MQSTLDEPKPESAYFLADAGRRTALLVFDLKSSSDIPATAEPWFIGFNASVDFMPVINASDLEAGLEKAAKGM